MNIWMIGKNSMKHHDLKKSFCSHLNICRKKDADYMQAKRAGKDFEIKI